MKDGQRTGVSTPLPITYRITLAISFELWDDPLRPNGQGYVTGIDESFLDLVAMPSKKKSILNFENRLQNKHFMSVFVMIESPILGGINTWMHISEIFWFSANPHSHLCPEGSCIMTILTNEYIITTWTNTGQDKPTKLYLSQNWYHTDLVTTLIPWWW